MNKKDLCVIKYCFNGENLLLKLKEQIENITEKVNVLIIPEGIDISIIGDVCIVAIQTHYFTNKKYIIKLKELITESILKIYNIEPIYINDCSIKTLKIGE